MSDRIPARADVSAENKWSIEDIYASDELWEKDLAKAGEYAEKIESYRGKLRGSAEALLEYFKLDDELTLLFDSLINYAQRKSDEDTRVAKYQDMCGRMEMLFVKISRASAFAVPEILEISDERIEQFLKEEPSLELYR